MTKIVGLLFLIAGIIILYLFHDKKFTMTGMKFRVILAGIAGVLFGLGLLFKGC